MDQDERQQRIAEAAYFRAERRGFTGNQELEDWFEAEREIVTLIADEELRAANEALPSQPDQTSGAPIPAPLDQESAIRVEEAKGSAEHLATQSAKTGEHSAAPTRLPSGSTGSARTMKP